jgi:hypothetical protein
VTRRRAVVVGLTVVVIVVALRGGAALVRQRADALKRLAGYAQAFWIERTR